MKRKKKVGYIILFANVLLFLIKGIAWFLTGSVAVKSESFNSLVDSVYSSLIVSGFFLSNREKTSEYPEGLVRLEPVISIIISILIVATGSKIAYDGITSLLFTSQYEIRFGGLALLVLIFSMGTKYIMYIFIKKWASEYNSPSLAATAVDTKLDVLISLIAFIGVVGYYIGIKELESIAAILIAGYVTYSGIKVAEENFEYAMGASVPTEVEETIRKAALKHEEVKGLHDVEIHYTGPIIDVSMHLEISGDMAIEDGHEIEISVADKIREKCSEDINEINIHLDPESLDEWKKD